MISSLRLTRIGRFRPRRPRVPPRPPPAVAATPAHEPARAPPPAPETGPGPGHHAGGVGVLAGGPRIIPDRATRLGRAALAPPGTGPEARKPTPPPPRRVAVRRLASVTRTDTTRPSGRTAAGAVDAAGVGAVQTAVPASRPPGAKLLRAAPLQPPPPGTDPAVAKIRKPSAPQASSKSVTDTRPAAAPVASAAEMPLTRPEPMAHAKRRWLANSRGAWHRPSHQTVFAPYLRNSFEGIANMRFANSSCRW